MHIIFITLFTVTDCIDVNQLPERSRSIQIVIYRVRLMLLISHDGWWLMCDEVYWNCSTDQRSWQSWTFWSPASSASESLYFYLTLLFWSLEPHLALVLHCCWFDNKKDIRSVKKLHWLIDWFIHSLIHWLVDSLIDWFIDWLIDWFIDWFINWFIDWFCLLSLGWTRLCHGRTWRSQRSQKKWREGQL